MLGLFLSALRFRVAVIFNGLNEASSLPNQALASTSLGFVGDGLFMSVPPGFTLAAMRCNASTMHVGALQVWSLTTIDPVKEMPATTFFVIKIAQTFFQMSGNPFAVGM